MLKQLSCLCLVACGQMSIEAAGAYIPRFEGMFEELYDAGRYKIIDHIIESDDVILEAGGFDGGDTVGLAAMVPRGKVLSFEPNPSRYKELAAKVAGLSNVQTYPFALGKKNGTALFYVCYGAQNDPAFEGASSLLPPSESMRINYQGPTLEVPCYVLDDWCKESGENKIDFMWLDLEGYELQVLKRATQILSGVKAIYIETNFYKFREEMTIYRDLKKFLLGQGFRVLSHRYYEGLQGNAIFVRNDLFDSIVEKLTALDE